MIDRERQRRERELFQDECEARSLEHRHLLICAATGTGKGRAVMRCIAASSSKQKWLVLCPEIAQVENFKRDLEKHGFSHLLGDRIEEVICYASFRNYHGGAYNLALNECHRLSELREDIAQTVSFEQIVSDSATVPSEVRWRLQRVCPFYEINLPLDVAISRGILPEPRVILAGVTLDNTTKNVQSERFVGGKKVPYWTTQRGRLDDLEKDLTYWQDRYDKKGEFFAQNKINNLGSQRKRFLAQVKTEATRKLLQQLGDKKLICFAGSVEQAEELGGEQAVHSKKGVRANRAAIEAFNEGRSSRLFANRMMREGMNLEDIEAGIIVQLDSGMDEGLNFIQCAGRVIRSDAPELYILYVKNTQDEKYAQRALQHVKQKYIKVISL